MNPKISVIVPVYNTEPYLRGCLESILIQTYAPLEIILVDNASTDGSGEICREFAKIDGRIRLVRLEKNNGPGGGRNAGLAAASGDYIGFVDADDYIDPDMYSYLANNALRYGADITICGFYEENDGCVQKKGVPELKKYTSDDALRELVIDRVLQNFLWQKLFRARLFSGISFPTSCAFCDVSSYRLFLAANDVVYLPEAKYHYRILAGSTIHRISPSVYIDRAEILLRRAEDLMKTHPQIRDLLVLDIFSAFILYYEAAAKFPGNPALRSALKEENLRLLRSVRKEIIAAGNYGFLGRLELNTMCRGGGVGRLLAPRIRAFTIFALGLRQKLREKRGFS